MDLANTVLNRLQDGRQVAEGARRFRVPRGNRDVDLGFQRVSKTSPSRIGAKEFR